MYMHEWLIAFRYLRGRHHQNQFASFVAKLAIGGLILGTAALIIILSVMNGFESVFRDKLLSGIADAQVLNTESHDFIPPPSLWQTLQNAPHVTGFAPYLDSQGLLKASGGTAGIFIRGVSPQQEPHVSSFAQHIIAGSWFSHQRPWHIIIGSDMAQALHLSVGDTCMIMTPGRHNPLVAWLPRLRRVTISGIFSLGLYEYDSAFVLLSLPDAQALFNHPGAISGIRLKFDQVNQAPALAEQLTAALPNTYFVTDWTQSHRAFFKAVGTEKMVMFIILALIIMVAAFNIVSSLVMVVHEKKSDIAILKTLGITPQSILRIFFIQGLVIGLVGTGIGAALGIFVAVHLHPWSLALEHFFHIQFLSKEVYMIHELPSECHWRDVLTTAFLSLALCLLAAIYPARIAARTHPAIALREHQ